MTEACVARLVYRSTLKSSWQARHDSTGEWHRWRTKARTGEADLLLPELERRPLHAREEDLLVGLQHGSKLLQAGLGVGPAGQLAEASLGALCDLGRLGG